MFVFELQEGLIGAAVFSYSRLEMLRFHVRILGCHFLAQFYRLVYSVGQYLARVPIEADDDRTASTIGIAHQRVGSTVVAPCDNRRSGHEITGRTRQRGHSVSASERQADSGELEKDSIRYHGAFAIRACQFKVLAVARCMLKHRQYRHDDDQTKQKEQAAQCFCRSNHRRQYRLTVAPAQAWSSKTLILRELGIDLVAPGQDAALHVEDVPEAGFLHGFLGLGGAHAALAVDYDLVSFV
jgi:hypothetical protein